MSGDAMRLLAIAAEPIDEATQTESVERLEEAGIAAAARERFGIPVDVGAVTR